MSEINELKKIAMHGNAKDIFNKIILDNQDKYFTVSELANMADISLARTKEILSKFKFLQIRSKYGPMNIYGSESLLKKIKNKHLVEVIKCQI